MNDSSKVMRQANANRRMFDAIAFRYDLMNRIISLGMDQSWRRKAVRTLGRQVGGRALDIGTGTGDLALEIVRQNPDAQVCGIDPSREMLAFAAEKVSRNGVSGSIRFDVGDATKLPYESASFSGVITGFCFRNIDDRLGALKEVHRVLRRECKLVILELSVPTGWVMARLHGIYGRSFLPLMAWLLSRGTAYRYLVQSVDDFPPTAEILGMLDCAGFENPTSQPLSGGVATITVGTKP